ncbi:MAG: NAD-dependent epimerase/dehydratase family protein [Anaerolineaceae bacterium]|nr:NAD-dependent epimerase/dehydratase family protein [Anaerolineaceae bacterium]
MNLVTGATGHIGNVLVKELTQRGESVRVLILPGEDLTPINDVNVEIVYGDILDPECLVEAFKDIDTVFHLAGLISIVEGEDLTVRAVNVEGTRNMIHAAMHGNVKKFIYTSSIHAFKRTQTGIVIDESIPIDPKLNIGAYDRSKAEATLLVQEYVKKGLPAVIVCPTGVIGPYDYKGSELGELMHGWMVNKVNYMIDGKYDFVDVRDVVQGMIQARDKGTIGQIYILSGQLLRVADLWELVKEILSVKSYLVHIPVKLARFATYFAELYYKISHAKPKLTKYSIDTLQTNAVISNSKARESLGYNPRPPKETVRDTVSWWNNHKKLGIH